MEASPNITFRHMEPTDSVREDIANRVAELEKFHPHIISCDVVVNGPSKKHVTGQEIVVQLTVQVPGPDIRVSQSLGRSQAVEDLNLAIHKAFETADRQLKEKVRKMGGVDVKRHAEIIHGTIDRLFEGEGYGFIKADDGNEVYFERDNLTGGDWNEVKVDMKVRFREAEGDKGPYAMNVTVLS